MRRSKITLLALTLVAAISATWNTLDEYDLLGSASAVIIFAAYWMALPLLNAVAGMRSAHPRAVRTALVLALLYTGLYLRYAANGPTSDRGEGAQHLHLLLVPPVTLVLTGFVLLAAFALQRTRAW
jgi:uncharacterized membrane protein YozB (DUF420 family)